MSELEDLLLSQGSSKTSLEGVVRTISKNKSAADVWRSIDRCKMYVQFSSDEA
jgi:hypothetical protein